MAVQPDVWPTNKLIAGLVSDKIFTAAWTEIFSQAYPPLGGEAVSMLAGVLLALGFAWFIPDRANRTPM